MTTPSRLAPGVDEGEQPSDWEAPLTRLLLLLEIASEPEWLRELADAAAAGPREDEPAGWEQLRE